MPVRIAFSSPVSIVAAHTVRIHSHGMHCNQQPETGRKPLALTAASHWAPIPIVLRSVLGNQDQSEEHRRTKDIEDLSG
jgi:hypothetical protein